MNRPLQPAARDAAVTKVARLTVGIVVASVVGTIGVGSAIAATAAPPKSSEPDYTGPAQPPPPADAAPGTGSAPGSEGTAVPADDRPESSSGDEDTTSGGS